MPAGPPVLTIHRSANQIGGNCVELAFDGHRLLLDAGKPLTTDDAAESPRLVPPTLDVTAGVEALVISHPHQDHFGLLRELPPTWPVWCGESAEVLIRMTAAICGTPIDQCIQHFQSERPFTAGPFTVTPYLTDHSAFDAHMLLVECGGRRLFYSGDFRRTGRKASLVERLMASPPAAIDVLLLEGTTLGRTEAFPTEAQLEAEFVALFNRTKGRVFVSWSAQNLDRTVTIYRACKRSGRTLVLDLYALDVLERLSALHSRLPKLGWPHLQAVVTNSMKRLYQDPARMNHSDFVQRCARSAGAIGAAKLQGLQHAVIMLRPPLMKDFVEKGLTLERHDAWVFSQWSGYLKNPDFQHLRQAFETAGASFTQLHTSGHASGPDLELFARRLAPRHLVPIHSFTWDQHLSQFQNVLRLKDGQAHPIL